MSHPQNPFNQQAPVQGIKAILAVGSGKGGVGKSTVAVNLALSLKKLGLNIGLLDADIYGPSIPRMLGALGQKPTINESRKMIPLERFGIKIMSIGFLVEENMAVIWRGPMLFKALDQFIRDVDWGALDILVIDLPPGTGDVQLSIAQKIPVSGGISVCTPQNVALSDAKKAIDMFEKLGIPHLGLVENMSSFLIPGTSESIDLFPKGELDHYLSVNKIEKLASIAFQAQIGLGCEAGIPYIETAKDSVEVKSFLELAGKIRKRLLL